MLILNVESLGSPILLRPSSALTDEELMRFSACNRGYKIERSGSGAIRITNPVGGIDSGHQGYVCGEFYQWAKRAVKGTTFSPNVCYNLRDGSCLSPDASWIGLDRWNALTVKQQAGFPPLCPDFLIEVRSASDSRSLVEEKMQLWLDNGAQLAWLVDPLDENVSIYRPGQATETLERPEEVSGSAPVGGFVLDCRPLWAA